MIAETDFSPGRRVAVITGATAGIGRAIARTFASRGYAVGLIGRSEDRLQATANELLSLGGLAATYAADVASAEAVDAAADHFVSRWGHIDIWLNNAMATVFSPCDQLSAAEIRRVTDVTYLGQVHGTLAALRHMTPRNEGTILQIGSALSYRAIPLQSAYCAAKFAVRGFTDAVRTELLHRGSRVRLTMVQLPAVNTPQFDWARSRLRRRVQPVGRIYTPEAIADHVFRAALDSPREVWIGRSSVQAILGTMVAPGWLDRKLASEAWGGQMTDEPADIRGGNLNVPPHGDPGVAGRFGTRARGQVWSVNEQQLRLGLAMVGLAGIAAACVTSFLLGAKHRSCATGSVLPRRRSL